MISMNKVNLPTFLADFNPLSPNSDQQQFCPNDTHTLLSWAEVMRIN